MSGVVQGHPGLVIGDPPTGAGSTEAEWWAYPPPPSPSPAAANGRDLEFRENTLPASLAWWTDPTVGSALTPATADDTPLIVTSLPAVRPRYQVNKRRRSWLQVQVPKSAVNAGGVFDAGSWWLLQPLTPTADESYYTRTQIPQAWVSGGGASSGVCSFLCIMAATAGVPDKNNAMIIGSQGNIGAATGGSFANMYSVAAGVATLRPAGASNQSVGAIAGFGIGRRASSNWRGCYMSNDSLQTRIVEEFALAFTPAFIGWWWRVENAVTYNPIVGADLLRLPLSANALPL